MITKPFANRAWNQTSAKACSQELLWLDQGREPKIVRPDRLIAGDRRNRGTALHDFSRLSLHLLFEKGAWPNAEKTLRAVLKSGGGKDRPGDLLGFMKGPGFPELIDDIGALLPKAVLFQENFRFEADDRIGSEHFVAIDGAGGVANYFQVPAGGYHGRIDWAELTRTYVLKVTDFKNRPAIHPRAELKAHEQLSFYLWMLAKHYPQAREQNPWQGIYYFEYGVQNHEEMTWAEVDANVERLMARIRHKQSLTVDKVAPEPGFGRCQYCEYIGECPAGSDLLEGKQGAIVDEASAAQAAKSLFVIDELRDATRKGLKMYCEEHGPVAIDDENGFGFVETKDIERDAKAISKILKNAGKDVWSVLKVDGEALDKLTKGDDDLKAKCDAHVKVARHGTTFKAYKPKRDKIVATPKVRGRVKKTDNGNKKRRGGTTATPVME